MKSKRSLLILLALIVVCAIGLALYFGSGNDTVKDPSGKGDELQLITSDDQTTSSPESTEPPESLTVPEEDVTTPEETDPQIHIDEHGTYTSKDDVALYIHTYGRLPDNFITKKQAQALGWDGGSLEPYAPGKCIGGSRFGNYEGILPEKQGRYYTECDVDTLGANKRGVKRIVFSNDGLIYYSDDHYETFELLYGEDNG